MSEVKLTYNSTDYIVRCNSVQPAWTNNLEGKPDANGTSAVEVHTNSFENPMYNIQGVVITEEAGTLTYAALLTMAKVKYDGTSTTRITLTVDYGENSAKNLVSSDGSTTAIPVVVKSFSPTIAVSGGKFDTGSNKVFVPQGSIVLKETA